MEGTQGRMQEPKRPPNHIQMLEKIPEMRGLLVHRRDPGDLK